MEDVLEPPPEQIKSPRRKRKDEKKKQEDDPLESVDLYDPLADDFTHFEPVEDDLPHESDGVCVPYSNSSGENPSKTNVEEKTEVTIFFLHVKCVLIKIISNQPQTSLNKCITVVGGECCVHSAECRCYSFF